MTFRLLNRLGSLTNFIYTMHLASLLTKHHDIRQCRFLLYVLLPVLAWCYMYVGNGGGSNTRSWMATESAAHDHSLFFLLLRVQVDARW